MKRMTAREALIAEVAAEVVRECEAAGLKSGNPSRVYVAHVTKVAMSSPRVLRFVSERNLSHVGERALETAIFRAAWKITTF